MTVGRGRRVSSARAEIVPWGRVLSASRSAKLRRTGSMAAERLAAGALMPATVFRNTDSVDLPAAIRLWKA